MWSSEWRTHNRLNGRPRFGRLYGEKRHCNKSFRLPENISLYQRLRRCGGSKTHPTALRVFVFSVSG
ncbi:MAG: hypothetical protein IKI11_02050 [Neisseriaceae bacterium]|nr:hypothetical protein [Neisseriaceae bacterium]